MNIKELIKHSIIKLRTNNIYTEYLIPKEYSPIAKENIFGSWLVVFESKELILKWIEINEIFKKFVDSNKELREVVKLEEIHKLDELTICYKRGFNEAYTTESYAEFLKDGDCKPNEWIIKHLEDLEKALEKPYELKLEKKLHREIIDRIIEKAFIQPNMEMKWTSEPYPWTLYFPPISINDLTEWD